MASCSSIVYTANKSRFFIAGMHQSWDCISYPEAWLYTTTHISFHNLSGHIPACLGGDKQRSRWSVQKCISLCPGLCFLHSVSDLLQIELCLDLCVSATVHRGRGARSEGVTGTAASDGTAMRLLLSLQLQRIWLRGLGEEGG